MPILPTDIDASYPDDPTHPGRKAHQQHHDALHALNNLIEATATDGYVLTKQADGTIAWEAPTGGSGPLDEHEADPNPHPGYLTPAEADLAYEPLGSVSTHAADTTSVHGIADTTVLATDAEVTAAISSHAAAADPHPGYETAAEGAARITSHEAAADPHTGYQKESEKGVASGYASLDSTTKVPIAQLPTGSTATTVSLGSHSHTDVATHAAAADPHTGYQKESEKGQANGYASLDASALIPDAQIPSTIARDTEVTSAVGTHEAAANPHPVYLTATEGNAAYEALGSVSTHAAAADPHTGYQRESEKGVANGYASLDATARVPDSQIPSTIARDAEVTSAISAHEAAADPHPVYLTTAEGNAAYEAAGTVASHSADTTDVHGIADTTVLATDAEVAAAVSAHAGAADPHPNYLTAAEGAAAYEASGAVAAHSADTTDVHGIADTTVLATDAEVAAAIAAHAGEADPHTVYQKESEKGEANGYASLDAATKVPFAQLPTGTTASTVSVGDHTHPGGGGDIAGHEAAADPHTGYQKESEKGVANGYASLDASALIPDEQIPAGIARDSEVTAAITAHEGAADPHAGYLTTAEGNAAYEPIGSVSTHAAAADPHPGYLTTAEGNAAYAPVAAGFPTGGTAGQQLIKASGTDYDTTWRSLDRSLTFVIDGGGSPISTGAKQAYILVPFDCTIQRWVLIADVANAGAVLDVWRGANYVIPTNADGIVGTGTKPLTGAGQVSTGSIFNWTTTLTANDIIEVEVESNTSAGKLMLQLVVRPR